MPTIEVEVEWNRHRYRGRRTSVECFHLLTTHATVTSEGQASTTRWELRRGVSAQWGARRSLIIRNRCGSAKVAHQRNSPHFLTIAVGSAPP